MPPAPPSSFPLFTALPAELQLQIWDSTVATLPNTLKMNLFEVHIPVPTVPVPPSPTIMLPRRHRRRVRSSSSSKTTIITNKPVLPPRNRRRRIICKSTLNKKKSPPIPQQQVTLRPCTAPTDPSIYKLRSALRQTSTDAARAVHRTNPNNNSYDDDVLYLRLTSTSPSPLTALFQSLWSPHLATTLHRARRIALDISQLLLTTTSTTTNDNAAPPPHQHDVAFLACTLQNDLEALYLVVDDAPAAARQLQEPGPLFRRLRGGVRAQDKQQQPFDPDVIYGVGTVWREVADWEALGWHERCPAFVFAQMFDEAVRLQQGNWYGEGKRVATFQGVRVLVAESE